MSKNIIISGGGTGGHIFPALAIANAIKNIEPSTNILFVGAKGKMEMEKIPLAGFEIIGLDIVGFNRANIFKNILLLFKIIKSHFESKRILKNFKADAAIGVGGYASFSILKAAQSLKIPTYIQEQNAFAGKSNKILGKKAKAIFTCYNDMAAFFEQSKCINVGNPIRKQVFENMPLKTDSIKHFGLDINKPVVAVVGGSLGARSINSAIKNNLKFFEKNSIQLIWQTGKLTYEECKDAAKGMGSIVVMDFIKDIQFLYCAADVIISRAGAGVIAELCVVGKPAIFVPFPHAAEDHQKHNAQRLVDLKAGMLIEDNELDNKLIDELNSLLNNKLKQNEMAENIIKFAVINADEKIAHHIINDLK